MRAMKPVRHRYDDQFWLPWWAAAVMRLLWVALMVLDRLGLARRPSRRMS
ncbi:hypothetical protein ACGFX4_09610 [Kitasatospora sp. NPDC048365]